MHPDDRERVRQVRNLNVGGIDTPPIEFRIFRPDGTIRWIRREAELTRDAAGMPVRLIATQQDITDQVDRESELRRRQRSLVRAQRMGRIGSVEVDLVTRTVTWSDEIYRIYGRDLAQGPANLETFLAHVHPDDRHLIEEFRAEHEHGIVIGPHDFRILRADGELRWIHREVELERDASGRPVTLFATEQDITETRLANEELAKSYVRLNHAQSVGRVGSIEIDLHTGKANWSETMYRLHGLDPANTPPSDELLLSMVYPEDRQTIVAARAKNLGGAQTDPIEFRIHARGRRDAMDVPRGEGDLPTPTARPPRSSFFCATSPKGESWKTSCGERPSIFSWLSGSATSAASRSIWLPAIRTGPTRCIELWDRPAGTEARLRDISIAGSSGRPRQGDRAQ